MIAGFELVQQWIVFLVMAAVFMGGIWFITPTEKKPVFRAPATRAERAIGFTSTPAHIYRHYRNPMRTLRKFLGDPSGRQWRKLRKYYNRQVPDGARRFAMAVQQMIQARYAPTKPLPWWKRITRKYVTG